MCECVRLPGPVLERVTQHRTPPTRHLSGALAEALEKLQAHQASGFHALRWRDEQPVSLLWISESAHTATAAATVELIDRFGSHPNWRPCLKLLDEVGLIGYPDAVEFFADGNLEVHLGVSTPEQQARRR